MTRIEELKKLSPQQRADSLTHYFQKNYKFFLKKYPTVANLMHAGSAPFHVDVTDDFLDITNTETGELCHPEGRLDRLAETLGAWTNSAWVDLIEGNIIRYPDEGKYSLYPERFQKAMIGRFPALMQRMQEHTINLPDLPNGKHFSNPVVFLGIFHGLHIDHYLSRTRLHNAMFIEPDIARFVLSCYFLDYQALEQRFEGLYLHVGNEMPEKTVDFFFNKSAITGAVWVRALPGYASGSFEQLLRKLRLRWRRPYDVFVPAEWHINGLRNAQENIAASRRMLAEQVALSPRSRIAVIGAGPSLSHDLAWLKRHEEQFVIFSVHSAVSALKQAGITPDFQFSLDIHWFSKEHLERFRLDPSVPVVDMVNDLPDKFASFKEVLMLQEMGGIYPVQFKHQVPFLTPTSGNMALAFACWCKPEQVYLFGLDFGFRKATQTHVAESSVYQNEAEHRSILGSGHLPVVANFGGVDMVTQSYFNLARMMASHPIARVAGLVEVFNCSDGSRIEGALPRHTGEIELKPYDKSTDVDVIRSMFMPLKEGTHWAPLPLDGAEQLEEFKKSMLRELKMKKFNWLKFTDKIDKFSAKVKKGLPRRVAKDIDNRIIPYLEIVNLLLTTWYRLLCFTNSEQEWQQVYDEGYAQLSLLVDEMEWPEGL